MNVIDDNKMQAVGDEVVARARQAMNATLIQFHDLMDGWTLTINIPPFALFGWSHLTIAIPEITVRLNKPKG